MRDFNTDGATGLHFTAAAVTSLCGARARCESAQFLEKIALGPGREELRRVFVNGVGESLRPFTDKPEVGHLRDDLHQRVDRKGIEILQELLDPL